MAVGRMAEIGRAGKRVGRHYTLFRGFGLQAALQTKQLHQFRPEMFEQDRPYCESRASRNGNLVGRRRGNALARQPETAPGSRYAERRPEGRCCGMCPPWLYGLD